MKRLWIGLSGFAVAQSSAWALGAGGLDFKGAFIESLFVTTGFGALGGILFWLIAGRYWGKAKAKPYQLGLWWGAWLDFYAVLVVGGNNYHKGWLELFGSLVATVPVFFVIGFLAGFVFRKLKDSFNISGASDVHFAEAMAEIEESRIDKGLWARCFAKSDGSHEKAKASYIRQRVAVFAAQVMPSANVGQVTEQPTNPAVGNSPPSLASKGRTAVTGGIIGALLVGVIFGVGVLILELNSNPLGSVFALVLFASVFGALLGYVLGWCISLPFWGGI